VRLDGKPITFDPLRLWVYNKPPKELVTTATSGPERWGPRGGGEDRVMSRSWGDRRRGREDDGQQQRTASFEQLALRYPELPRLTSVGRLDYHSEGLLLLTNSGALARHLEIPNSQWERRYRVRVRRRDDGPFDIDPEWVRELARGAFVRGIEYGPIRLEVETELPNDNDPFDPLESKTNGWLSMTLVEGKNREIRNVLGDAGFKISRLQRVSFGPFVLPPSLPLGELVSVDPAMTGFVE
jgi:pseudouridine synthase